MTIMLMMIPVIVLKELGSTVADAVLKARDGIELGSVSAFTKIAMMIMMIMILMMMIILLPLIQYAMKCCHKE